MQFSSTYSWSAWLWVCVAINAFFIAGSAAQTSHLVPASVSRDSIQHCTTYFNAPRKEYLLGYKDSSFNILYSLRVNDTNILRGMISLRATVNEQERLYPIFQGGLIVQSATGHMWLPHEQSQDRSVALLSHELKNNQVIFQFKEKIFDQILHKAYRFSIQGKSLIIRATGDITHSATAYYSGFDFGRSRLSSSATIHTLPSSPYPLVYLKKGLFFSTYVDPFQSTTGHYDTTLNMIRRSLQASNTPAWLLKDSQNQRPPLDVISYLTVSDRLKDVVPIPSKMKRTTNPIRDHVVLDLQELPFLHQPYQPVEIIRRWESPQSGRVDLKGVFQLHKSAYASCSVILIEANQEKEHILYSQILDENVKQAAGMEGSFPLSQGDQLLFVVSGPAIMTGGAVLLEARLQQNGQQYHSYNDFSNRQGNRGWYFEQRVGSERTLMIWNPQQGQWESPSTRSYQTPALSVCRRGEAGDAFESAQLFFDELRWLGIRDVAFLAKEWSDHARIAPLPNFHHSQQVWGTSHFLQRLTEQEGKHGNLWIPVVSMEHTGFPDLEHGGMSGSMQSIQTLLDDTHIMDKMIQNLQDSVSQMDTQMKRHGLMLQAPRRLGRIKTPGLFYQLMGVSPPSSNRICQQVGKVISTLKTLVGAPLLLSWTDPTLRFDLYGGFAFEGVSSPLQQTSTERNVVDYDIRYQRLYSPHIGFGGYEGYLQKPFSGKATDLRMFPFDQYMTSTVAYARIPLISGQVWFPEMHVGDIRRYLTEAISLLQPVAREYMNPAHAVKRIRYQTGDPTSPLQSIEDLFLHQQTDQATRVLIEYENGLHVYANRNDKPWTVDLDPLHSVTLSGDGFFAHNEASGLFALISEKSGIPFSVCVTKDSYFLHSRNGELLRWGDYATDGMIRCWKNAVSPYPNMACLASREINRTQSMIPVMRSNRRIDASVQWNSVQQVTLRILQANESPVLVEFFDIPPSWFDADKGHIAVTKPHPTDDQDKVEWYETSSGNVKGLRFPDVQTGNQYIIRHIPGNRG